VASSRKLWGGVETILFVEDEAFVRDVTCEVLRSAGYRVLTAKNAVEARLLCDQSSADVELLIIGRCSAWRD
jgi:CheY-like chemotaxis protein